MIAESRIRLRRPVISAAPRRRQSYAHGRLHFQERARDATTRETGDDRCRWRPLELYQCHDSFIDRQQKVNMLMMRLHA